MITELDQYQKEVMVTANQNKTDVERQVYANAKLVTEIAEIMDPILKHWMHGKPLPDKDYFLKECGDALYYIGWVANLFGYTLSEVATENIKKLRARHGTSYNQAFYTEGKNANS